MLLWNYYPHFRFGDRPFNFCSGLDLARALGVAPRTVNEICNGKRAISCKMALLLAGYFDTTPELWMNLQMAWDMWKEWEKYKDAS
jgi:addiction module HigA family antidote